MPACKGHAARRRQHGAARLPAVPGKIMGQLIRDSINKLRKGNINNANQVGCTGNRSCQTKLTSSFNEIMSLVDKGNSVVMDVCTAFELVPHNILIKKAE